MRDQREMPFVRFSRHLVVVGALLTAISVVAGFGLLTVDRDEAAMSFLSLAPVGMLLALGGLVGALLGGPPGPQRGPGDD